MSGAYRYLAAVVVDALGAGCPGLGAGCPGPGDFSGSFRRSSSSVNLGTCPSSRASSKGSSWYLTMHNISDLGSSHVSSGSYVISLRKEVTSVSRALARARVIGPLGTW